ncbi:MAG: type VI secretion system-associated FHA domain protein TagH [Azoarcus sp.]|nr:type VI secretion system-associated FHA domain protein TagH [Azoarcus sp.]
MLTLTVKALHLTGEHSEIRGTFDTSEVSIGRHDECDVVLPDPDRRISRMQARLLHVNGQCVVCNASTSNPMYVNEVELPPGASQAIADGSVLRVGSYAITVSQADQTSPPVQLQRVERDDASTVFTDTRLEASAAPTISVVSDADPFLAFRPGADAGLNANAAASVDFLSEATPFGGTAQADLNATTVETLPPSDAGGHFDGASGSREWLTPHQSGAETTSTPVDELPLAQQSRAAGPHTIAQEEPSAPSSVESEQPPTTGVDPNDPFGDLLATRPSASGISRTASAATSNAQTPPWSTQDSSAGLVERRSERIAQDFSAASNRTQPGLHHIPENPFELPAASSSHTPRKQSGAWQSPSPALAGDPFADLMGAPVQDHVANAPAFHPASSQRTTYIPQDFNPLAAGGVSQRNSSDPLTPMGIHAKGLADVIPKSTIDSIYNPGSESPTTLAVDPLQHTKTRALKLEQSVDPLKLFANDSPDMLGAKPETDTGHSTRNDAREMVAAFRAPVPRMDPNMPAADPAGYNRPAWSEPTPSSDRAAPAQPAPIDSALNGTAAAAPTMTPFSPGVDSTSRPPQPPQSWPAAVVSEPLPDKVESGFMPDSAPTGSALQFAPAAPTVSSFVVANLRADSHPINALQAGGQNSETLMAAFKRGAGLEEWSATFVTPELMEMLGRLLETAVQGAVSLLAARAAIKQEIHLPVTLINPKANNPLKFLPDGHTALLQMLGPKMPGFMMPVEAMQEAFHDLLIHQTAIAAGTQATVKALFNRFNPDSIESQYSKSGITEKLSQNTYHARLWNTYAHQYRLLKEEMKDDFFRRLGAEFHDAYNKEYDHHADDEPDNQG